MIKIKTLVENTSVSSTYKHKHGICFYIETSKHKLLFDLGKDNLFLENAKKMNIDISDVDIVVISHGHKDHAGALGIFLEHNQKAKIYIREKAFDRHFTKVLGINVDISIDEALKDNPRLVFTEEQVVIDEELTLFTNTESQNNYSKQNRTLRMESEGEIVQDDFAHEQALIISDEERKTLLSGCSHTGIVNIKKKAESIANKEMDYVIGGFHLYNPASKVYEDPELIEEIAEYLKQTNTTYYTCHCTGVVAYNELRVILGERLKYASAGSEIIL